VSKQQRFYKDMGFNKLKPPTPEMFNKLAQSLENTFAKKHLLFATMSFDANQTLTRSADGSITQIEWNETISDTAFDFGIFDLADPTTEKSFILPSKDVVKRYRANVQISLVDAQQCRISVGAGGLSWYEMYEPASFERFINLESEWIVNERDTASAFRPNLFFIETSTDTITLRGTNTEFPSFFSVEVELT